MKVSVTNDIRCANAVTHGGLFHADEVMATVILSRIKDILVYRCFTVPEHAAPGAIIYDIGRGTYDHHQKGGNGKRENGVPYAACGLIWRDFGLEALRGACGEGERESVWQQMDELLIQGIDAADNGTALPAGSWAVTDVISCFNPTWDSRESTDDAFLRAVAAAGEIFENALRTAVSEVRARRVVENALLRSANHILVMEAYAPWARTILTSEAGKDVFFVVYPSHRGGWCCQAVPESLGSYQTRRSFPEAWRGADPQALRELTGIKTVTFCHPAGFICASDTREDAIRLAETTLLQT